MACAWVMCIYALWLTWQSIRGDQQLYILGQTTIGMHAQQMLAYIEPLRSMHIIIDQQVGYQLTDVCTTCNCVPQWSCGLEIIGFNFIQPPALTKMR